MPKQVINPNADPNRPPSGISQGTRTGNLLFIAGQIGRDGSGKVPPTFEGQVRQVFKNMESVVTAAGGRMSDVVKITCFVTDFDNLPIYRKVRLEVFPSEPPASTTVIVKSLAGKEYLIEVEAVAALS